MSEQSFIITPTTDIRHFHTISLEDAQTQQAKTVRPFDLKTCMELYRSTFPSHEDDYAYRLNMYGLPNHHDAPEEMSKEEATFWIHALTNEAIFTKWREDAEVFEALEEIDFDDILDYDGVKTCFDDLKTHLSTHYYGFYSFSFLAWPIRRLLGFKDGLLFLLEELSMDYLGYFLDVFGVTPEEESDEDLSTIVGNFASQLDMTTAMHNWYFSEAMMNLLMCGPDQEQIIRFCDAFIAAKRTDYSNRRNKLIALIDDDELYKSYLKSMSVCLQPIDIQIYLDRLGFEELPYLMKLLHRRHNKSRLSQLTDTMAMIHSRFMVESLLDMAEIKGTKQFAEAYLMEEGANAMAGLLDQAERRGKKRDQAVRFLRRHVEAGNREMIDSQLEARAKRLKDIVKKEVFDHQDVTFDVLPGDALTSWMKAFAKIAPDDEANPAFGLASAPALLVNETALCVPESVIRGMLFACELKHRKKRRSDAKSFKPLRAKNKAQREACAALMEMKQDIDVESGGLWAWHLFSSWVVGGAEDRLDWITYLLGYLGTPVEAINLETYVRSYNKWFSYYGEPQAKVVMDALKLMDIPAAWVVLMDLSRKQRSGALEKYAKKLVTKIMKEKHWNMETFEDMSVPSCGLDARGTRRFDYGTRSFELTIHSANTFGVVDSEGTVFQKIPPRRKTDDKEKVAVSREVYKAMTKQIKQVFGVQKGRMEDAMAVGRQWDVSDWKSRIFEHPLMRHLARTMVWQVFDERGQSVGAMLPTEDNSCLTSEYEPFALPDAGHVSIFHPIHMQEDERREWSDVLADFDIIQPFDQLGRPVYTFDEGDEDMIHESLMKVYSLWYAESRKACAHAGWPVTEGRYAITRHFERANIKAVMTFDLHFWQNSEIADLLDGDKRRILFFKGDQPNSKETFIKPEDVDSAVYSEVILSVHRIVEHFTNAQ